MAAIELHDVVWTVYNPGRQWLSAPDHVIPDHVVSGSVVLRRFWLSVWIKYVLLLWGASDWGMLKSFSFFVTPLEVNKYGNTYGS